MFESIIKIISMAQIMPYKPLSHSLLYRPGWVDCWSRSLASTLIRMFCTWSSQCERKWNLSVARFYPPDTQLLCTWSRLTRKSWADTFCIHLFSLFKHQILVFSSVNGSACYFINWLHSFVCLLLSISEPYLKSVKRHQFTTKHSARQRFEATPAVRFIHVSIDKVNRQRQREKIRYYVAWLLLQIFIWAKRKVFGIVIYPLSAAMPLNLSGNFLFFLLNCRYATFDHHNY